MWNSLVRSKTIDTAVGKKWSIDNRIVIVTHTNGYIGMRDVRYVQQKIVHLC